MDQPIRVSLLRTLDMELEDWLTGMGALFTKVTGSLEFIVERECFISGMARNKE